MLLDSTKNYLEKISHRFSTLCLNPKSYYISSNRQSKFVKLCMSKGTTTDFSDALNIKVPIGLGSEKHTQSSLSGYLKKGFGFLEKMQSDVSLHSVGFGMAHFYQLTPHIIKRKNSNDIVIVFNLATESIVAEVIRYYFAVSNPECVWTFNGKSAKTIISKEYNHYLDEFIESYHSHMLIGADFKIVLKPNAHESKTIKIILQYIMSMIVMLPLSHATNRDLFDDLQYNYLLSENDGVFDPSVKIQLAADQTTSAMLFWMFEDDNQPLKKDLILKSLKLFYMILETLRPEEPLLKNHILPEKRYHKVLEYLDTNHKENAFLS